VKTEYETITSIHIYSLSPTKLPDLVALTDIGRGLYTDVFVKEDPLLHNKTYGVIQNPEVRRRKGKRPVPSTAPVSKFQPVKDQLNPAAAPSKHPSTLKKEETASRPSSRDSTSSKQPTLKRGNSGANLFKAFAKSQPPKPKNNDSQDTKMSDAPKLASDDEGESEDEALFLDTGARKPAKRASDVKKEREDKAAKLRKMMDSDDEEGAVPKVEDQAAKASGPLATYKAPEGDEDEGGVAWSDSDGEGKTEKNALPEPAGPRRKRGKKKVMKKKTTKDEEGYLVTKEEAVWESFSESDNEPEKKPAPKSSGFAAKTQSSQSQRSAAGGKKKGKGDIMSFFGKK
jgi:DNA polymerase subunit Cdc27